MADHVALPVEFTGAMPTDDGTQVLLRFKQGDVEQAFAVDSDSLMPMMAVLSDVAGKVAKIRREDPNMRHVFDVKWWDIGKHEDRVVFSFELPGGSRQAFQIHRDAAVRFQESLGVMLGQGGSPGPDVTRN